MSAVFYPAHEVCVGDITTTGTVIEVVNPASPMGRTLIRVERPDGTVGVDRPLRESGVLLLART